MSASPETSTSLDVNFELPSMSSQLNTDSEIDSSLAHEPSIIRGKGGERLLACSCDQRNGGLLQNAIEGNKSMIE